ncbi:Gryzun, putative trafficking through golgi-domain-containing protein [Lipomyces japonicus]|uniref:Gryzun, putative trafficking through golgi-domain-containing protein n=1 Tax=Lipomyces japonicus TaxID=56871 RepID=UPI0034CDB905
MEVYPYEYLCHNLPLMLVGGLTAAAGQQTSARAPDLSIPDSPKAIPEADTAFPFSSDLLKAFNHGPDGLIWEESAVKHEKKNNSPIFRTVQVAKTYVLPAKKAAPMSPLSTSSASSKVRVLHSPLSPLSQESPLYPDGLISPFWLKKYRNHVPAVFISFYQLFFESEDAQIKSTQDTELVKQINDFKRQFTERNIKFVVVIVSTKTILQSIDVNDRIAFLRKGTGLDARSGLFLLPPSSPLEIQLFVKELKQNLYPYAIEFYGALIKHARKKRGKNGTPNSSLLDVQPLSSNGWNLRYEFKQAVFAEYRQEIDIAIKLYGGVYEALLDYIDSIPINSSRWLDSRMLLDIVAFKILKCNLYLGQPVMAQKVFNVHIESVSALIERHFSTTQTYSYFNWKAKQYQLLAELLDLVPDSISQKNVPFAGVNKAIVGSDFPSANVLHHAGYQYLNAARNTIERALHASDGIMKPYDLYLALSPDQEQKYDHASIVISLLESAYSRFSKGDGSQTRMQSFVAFEIAKAHFKKESYQDALKYFSLAASVYRQEKWYKILGSVLSEAVIAANRLGNKDELIKLQFELLSNEFRVHNSRIPIIEKFILEDGTKTQCNISADSIIPFVSVHFAFSSAEVHVSSQITGQLTIQSNHTSTIRKITPSSVKVSFEGSLTPVTLVHDGNVISDRIQRYTSNIDQTLEANLSFEPGEVKTFEFAELVKSLGIIKASQVQIEFEAPALTVTLNISLDNNSFASNNISRWFVTENEKVIAQHIPFLNPRILKVIPKQPNFEINAQLKGPAYLGEKLIVPITFTNKEEDQIDGQITILTEDSEGHRAIDYFWDGHKEENSVLALGQIKSLSSVSHKLFLSMPSEASDLVVTVTVAYHIMTDPDIQISKTCVIDIPVILPFHVTYDLTPRIYPQIWKSPFFIYDLESHCPPITKRWCLSTTIDAVDLTHLKIEDYSFEISNSIGVECNIVSGAGERLSQESSSDAYTHNFILDVTNIDQVERRNTNADAKLSLTWRRTSTDDDNDDESNSLNKFFLPMFKLTFPLLEPRVLLDVESTSSELVHLIYYIENVTSHILTFSVTLDLNNEMSLSYPIRHQLRQHSYNQDGTDQSGSRQSSDIHGKDFQQGSRSQANFAYEGAKQIGVRVLPYTARRLEYKLLPLAVTSGWQRIPALRVYDTHFKKSLSVFPANEKFKIDFKTGGVFVNISS